MGRDPQQQCEDGKQDEQHHRIALVREPGMRGHVTVETMFRREKQRPPMFARWTPSPPAKIFCMGKLRITAGPGIRCTGVWWLGGEVLMAPREVRKVFVLDTNVILHDSSCLSQFKRH